MIYEVTYQAAARHVIHESAPVASVEAEKVSPRGVFTLRECPAVACGNFVLARRGDGGHLVLLAMGRIHSHCATSNLARIRQLGAELGANEVHLLPA